jgi:hypothetical protein
MKFSPECHHVSLDSLISRDWAISPKCESDALREQALSHIHGDNEDKALTPMQAIRNRYEQNLADKQKEQLAANKAAEFRHILLGA